MMEGGNTGVTIHADSPVWRLSIVNPAQRNALRPEISRALAAALRQASDSADCRVVVLNGSGDTFCSGGDVRAIAEQQCRPASEQVERLGAINDLVRALRRCRRPVIAAVEGHAAGAGASIALACDLIVASRDARFAIAHVRLGIAPDGGATLAIPRALPLQMATEWLMTGAPMTAERLHAAGLVNRLTAPGEAIAEAIRVATELARQAPAALTAIKGLVTQATLPDLDAQLERERDAFVSTMFEQESRSLAAKFLQRTRS